MTTRETFTAGDNKGGEVMTEFLIENRKFPMWMTQNRAAYTGDYFPGVLLDNFVLECKHGFAAVYEHLVSEWSSCYRVVFGKTESDIKRIFDDFAKAEDAFNEVMEEALEEMA